MFEIENDDVDDDFFTPHTSTSLANLFHKTDRKEENSSLKYTPPKPNKFPESSKISECIFACAVVAYQWINDAYISRGKVGLAIMNIVNDSSTNILIYDSQKLTLSCATLIPTLEIKIKGETYISYFDNSNKYWSITGTKDEIDKIIEVFLKYNVNILPTPLSNTEPTVATVALNKDNNADKDIKLENATMKVDDKNFSVEKSSKASIINRIANMGHSVFPSINKLETSDSSFNSDSDNLCQASKHKVKSHVKKSYDKVGAIRTNLDIDRPKTVTKKYDENVTDIPCINVTSNQMLPMPATNIISNINTSNDFSQLLADQRINNTEARINIGRLNDKLDLVIGKLNDHKISSHQVNDIYSDVLKKLLKEYELKIANYETFILSKGFNPSNINVQSFSDEVNSQDVLDFRINDSSIEIKKLNNKLKEMEHIIKVKDAEILNLKEGVSNNTLPIASIASENNSSILIKQLDELKIEILNNRDKLDKMQINLENISKIDSDSKLKKADFENKVKCIMKSVFQSVCNNFETEKQYTGCNVKTTVGTVIKQVTIDMLQEKNTF